MFLMAKVPWTLPQTHMMEEEEIDVFSDEEISFISVLFYLQSGVLIL